MAWTAGKSLAVAVSEAGGVGVDGAVFVGVGDPQANATCERRGREEA